MNFLFEIIFSRVVFDFYIEHSFLFKMAIVVVSCVVGSIAFFLFSLIVKKIFKIDWIEMLKQSIDGDKFGKANILFLVFNMTIAAVTMPIIDNQSIDGVAYYIKHNGKYSTIIKEKCIPEYMKQNKLSFSAYQYMCINNTLEEETETVDEQRIKKEQETVGKVFENSTQKQ